MQARVRLEAKIRATVGQRDPSRLRAMLAEVDSILDAVLASTRGYLAGTLPAVYAQGAVDTSLPFAWTQSSREAVQALAARNWDELLTSTRYVRRTTKTALRELVHAGALDVLTGQGTASAAGLAVTNLVQDAAGDVFTVRYSNGARHALADYADTALRTQTALAYNDGALDQFGRYDVRWVECIDGPSCGLTAHDDPELANGLVVTLDVAREYPLAHPRCARSWSPRVDIASERGASRHNARRDPAELAAQSLAERQRAATATVTGRRFTVASEERRVARRVARTARTPRSASR